MKFHAALNPVHTRSRASRNIQNLGAARNTAPTAPSRPCRIERAGRSGSIATAAHTKMARAAEATTGIAHRMPTCCRSTPISRHAVAYARLSHPRMRPYSVIRSSPRNSRAIASTFGATVALRPANTNAATTIAR